MSVIILSVFVARHPLCDSVSDRSCPDQYMWLLYSYEGSIFGFSAFFFPVEVCLLYVVRARGT